MCGRSGCQSRVSYLLLVLSLVVLVLAGCTGGPVGQEGPVPVIVNNSATVNQTFEVWVVETPANVTTRRNDGLVGHGQIGEGLASHSPGENYTWTAVELPPSARLHGRYELEPGEENRSTMSEFPQHFAVVVIIYQGEDRIIWWISSSCDEASMSYVEVMSYPDPPGGALASSRCV